MLPNFLYQNGMTRVANADAAKSSLEIGEHIFFTGGQTRGWASALALYMLKKALSSSSLSIQANKICKFIPG